MTLADEASDGTKRPETVTFGRTLADGPTDDRLTSAVDSPTVALSAEASSPLISNPVLGEYETALVEAEDVDGAFLRAPAITPSGAAGPAEHYHLHYEESFEVVEVEGPPQTLGPGESVTVEVKTPHTFRNESDSYATCVIETRPAGRFVDVVQLLFGLAHDGKLPETDRSSVLQAMVMADEMGDDTVFTSPPPAGQTDDGRVRSGRTARGLSRTLSGVRRGLVLGGACRTAPCSVTRSVCPGGRERPRSGWRSIAGRGGP
jgi:mannose-6-phosphate isomerase-like protein (cupin superfamily)